MKIKTALFLLPVFAFAAASCSKTSDYSRAEYLLVQDPSTGQFVQNPTIACNESGTFAVKVRSNVDFTVSCRTSATDGDWVVAGQMQDKGEYIEIPLSVKLQDGAPMLRNASLALSCQEFCLGNFVTLTQGYAVRAGSDFSFLRYGSANPLEGLQGKLMSEWTEEETLNGWTSTVYTGQQQAWCYGRNGYIQLGDDACHGADLLTPYEANIVKDTILLVYFDAVAHTSSEGVKDSGSLTVTVEGGGQFEDGSVSKTLALGNLDPNAEDVAAAMWKNASYNWRIISGKDNVISSNTRVRLTAGKDTMTSCNRVYVKNFYLFKVK